MAIHCRAVKNSLRGTTVKYKSKTIDISHQIFKSIGKLEFEIFRCLLSKNYAQTLPMQVFR